ncbi:uncharacterized protein LOC119385753 [Rhipicephalus sanguineus]|uniref:uncharacterized protein LOC119385753 n=1 Tax=Rhipicephalus sanguineus TaxID=34632 RepID=UPI0020C3A470|nr:uncharacterized protein LOC119385753 [Rhipicephalus sanguineus]
MPRHQASANQPRLNASLHLNHLTKEAYSGCRMFLCVLLCTAISVLPSAVRGREDGERHPLPSTGPTSSSTKSSFVSEGDRAAGAPGVVVTTTSSMLTASSVDTNPDGGVTAKTASMVMTSTSVTAQTGHGQLTADSSTISSTATTSTSAATASVAPERGLPGRSSSQAVTTTTTTTTSTTTTTRTTVSSRSEHQASSWSGSFKEKKVKEKVKEKKKYRCVRGWVRAKILGSASTSTTTPTMYPSDPLLFDSRRYSNNPVAPGRWPVRSSLHPMKSSAKVFGASSVAGPGWRSSLPQPATQAREKYHQNTDENSIASGAVSIPVNTTASMLDLLASDNLLQWPNKRETKASRCTLVLAVICFTCTCALISAMLVESYASVVHDYDLAAGRPREQSLELDAQATRVTAEIATRIILESRPSHGRTDKAHRWRGRNFTRTLAHHNSRGRLLLPRATTSSRPIRHTLGAGLAGLPNVMSRSAIEGVSSAYVKQRTTPTPPPVDNAAPFPGLVPFPTEGSSGISTTLVFSFEASTGSKISSGRVLSETSKISLNSSAIPSLPEAATGTEHDNMGVPLISVSTAGSSERFALVADATKGIRTPRIKLGELH